MRLLQSRTNSAISAFSNATLFGLIILLLASYYLGALRLFSSADPCKAAELALEFHSFVKHHCYDDKPLERLKGSENDRRAQRAHVKTCQPIASGSSHLHDPSRLMKETFCHNVGRAVNKYINNLFTTLHILHHSLYHTQDVLCV